jgi:calpain-15
MAEQPETIMNLFITKRVNNHGIYCVKLCLDGEWKAVYIDDYFPVYLDLVH